MRAVLVERPGNAPLSAADRAEFTVVQTFAEVSLDTAVKRKLEADDEEVHETDSQAVVAQDEVNMC